MYLLLKKKKNVLKTDKKAFLKNSLYVTIAQEPEFTSTSAMYTAGLNQLDLEESTS